MLKSWKRIGEYIGVSRDTAAALADRILNPLPVMRLSKRTVLARESELDAWLDRTRRNFPNRTISPQSAKRRPLFSSASRATAGANGPNMVVS